LTGSLSVEESGINIGRIRTGQERMIEKYKRKKAAIGDSGL
jgi:hypothetical protein